MELVREHGSEDIQQETVDTFVSKGCATIFRWCKPTEWNGADNVWAALAVLRRRQVIKCDFVRRLKGGAEMVQWQQRSIKQAGWSTGATRAEVAQDLQVLKDVVMNAFRAGTENEEGVITVELGYLSSTLRRLKRWFRGDTGVHLYHTIVAWCALDGLIIGDIGRRKTGGKINEVWWPDALDDLLDQHLINEDLHLKVSNFLNRGKDRELLRGSQVEMATKESVWFLDLCCGSKSRKAPIISTAGRLGIEAVYIGVDICPSWWDGSEFQVPEMVGDLMDEQTFPSNKIVSSIADRWGLNMDKLAHIYMSTPCQTNSKADASNRNRMCGYRNWRQPFCPPLPIGEGAGFTSPEHRERAILHDKLEIKVIVGIASEAHSKGFTFSAENPVGAMHRKKHMCLFTEEKWLAISRVNYCAFGGHYMKNTHLFHNMPWYHPCGTSGNGLCAKKGKGGRAACPVGQIINGKFLHLYTIGRESTKEFVTSEVSRRRGKNEIPCMLTEEMTQTALEEWLEKQDKHQDKRRKQV